MRISATLALVLVLSVLLSVETPAAAMDIVKDGKAVAVIVVGKDAADAATAPAGKAKKRGGPAASEDDEDTGRYGSAVAAETLAEWVKKMSGADLPIVSEAPAGAAAIYIGKAAQAAGLKLDDIQSISNEGLKVVCDGKRILIAGQNGRSTVKAVCRLLEELGCRYYNDIGELGMVYPSLKTVTVKDALALSEKPGMWFRKNSGSGWPNQGLFGVWNGTGGLPISTSHSWGLYVEDSLFETHPEYFALVNGQRVKGDWYCTSNPALRKVFAQGVMRVIERGTKNPSISPPDGTRYCQCEPCKAQDDPRSIEPSSGKVCITNRYVDFFNDVARQVARVHPESKLSFYVYADYTQAPTNGVRVEDNLIPFLAPIRYCRYHRTGHPDCPSRVQLQEMVDGWARLSKQFAYRTYNFNLAECTVPFSLLDTWKHDIPYLTDKGCVAVSNESLGGWSIYGPFLYQSLRLAYDPKADSDALMNDYYMGFYGPKAGPIMKEYWTAIDKAFVDMKCHAGGFHAVTEVYTPEFLSRCQAIMDRAAQAAKDDKACAARVAIANDGLKNGWEYRQVFDAMNRGDFIAAKKIYDAFFARATEAAGGRDSYGMKYTLQYLPRFIGKFMERGEAAVQPPRKVLAVLPDKMKLAYDPEHQGEAKGYARAQFDDSAWKTVSTFQHTLSAQGMEDVMTVMWYRSSFDLPAGHGKISLFATEIDGNTILYVNGKKVEAPAPANPKAKNANPGMFPKRAPFEADITEAVVAGRNTIALSVDHTNISELFLGGILRPILIIDRGDLGLSAVVKSAIGENVGRNDPKKPADKGGEKAKKDRPAKKKAAGANPAEDKPAPGKDAAPAEKAPAIDPGIGE